MRERTLTISSAAKSFSLTGWKIGWVTGPTALIRALRTVKQYLTFANGTPFQYAIAYALDNTATFTDPLGRSLMERRDLLAQGLADLGLQVFDSDATYFLTTDLSVLGVTDGLAFARALPQTHGVAVIPSSVFYRNSTEGRAHLRWTFCKTPATLERALDRLSQSPLQNVVT